MWDSFGQLIFRVFFSERNQNRQCGRAERRGRCVGSSCRLFDLAREVNGPIEGPKAVPVILTSHTSKPALLCLAFPHRQEKGE